MEVNLIVAAGRDGAIGKEGDLIWKISEDLKRFKRLTMGHPLIMGRKTWESLPKRPLPGRLNIVLSRDRNFIAEGATVCTDPEEALRLAGEGNPFVMGGAQIYNLFLPFVTRMCVTEIDAECQDADAYLAFSSDDWRESETGPWVTTPDGIRYRYVEYRRK